MSWLLKHKITKQIEAKHNGYNLQLNYHFADIVSDKENETDLFLTDDDLYFRKSRGKRFPRLHSIKSKTKRMEFHPKVQ